LQIYCREELQGELPVISAYRPGTGHPAAQDARRMIKADAVEIETMKSMWPGCRFVPPGEGQPAHPRIATVKRTLPGRTRRQ